MDHIRATKRLTVGFKQVNIGKRIQPSKFELSFYKSLTRQRGMGTVTRVSWQMLPARKVSDSHRDIGKEVLLWVASLLLPHFWQQLLRYDGHLLRMRRNDSKLPSYPENKVTLPQTNMEAPRRPL